MRACAFFATDRCCKETTVVGIWHTFSCLNAAFIAVCLVAVQPVSGESYTLRELVDRAVGRNPQLKAAGADVEIAHALSDQARAARILPKFDLTFAVGPSPEARGDALIGDTDLSSLSLFTRTEATFIQPLFTFGKLAAAQEAARHGIEARAEHGASPPR